MVKIKTQILVSFIFSLIFGYGFISELFADNLKKTKQQMILNSIAKYPGKCACPYQLMSNGRKCGKQSAYSKPGGHSPLCYPDDISEDLINLVKIKKKYKKPKDSFINPYNLRIIDGDTIVLNSQKIRLYGIDTPEIKQICKDKLSKPYFCGLKATKELKNIIGTEQITCKTKDKDRYGRLISVCFVKGKNINAILVKNGWALAYRKYSNDYVNYENEAKFNKLGLWSGTFTPPWLWRKIKK